MVLHLLVEASRVPPGPVRARLPDRDHFGAWTALVRRRHRQSHHPRAESHQGVRTQGSRREEPVPWRQVSGTPGRVGTVARGGWGRCSGKEVSPIEFQSSGFPAKGTNSSASLGLSSEEEPIVLMEKTMYPIFGVTPCRKSPHF